MLRPTCGITCPGESSGSHSSDRIQIDGRDRGRGNRVGKAQTCKRRAAAGAEDSTEGFNKEWDRRAVVTAAALAARDYGAPTATRSSRGQGPSCMRPPRKRARTIPGSDQIEYNATAIASAWSDRAVSERSGCRHARCATAPRAPSTPRRGQCAWPQLSGLGGRQTLASPRVAHSDRDDELRSSSQARSECQQNEANQQAYREKVEARLRRSKAGWMVQEGEPAGLNCRLAVAAAPWNPDRRPDRGRR